MARRPLEPFGHDGDFFIGIGTAAILTGLTRSEFELSLGLFFIGLFASIYHPVGIPMVVQGQDKVGKLLGINGVWGNMGIAAAAIVAGALGEAISWRAAFYVPGAVAVVTGLVYVWMARAWPLSDKIAGPKKENMMAAIASSPEARQALWRVVAILGMAALLVGLVFQTSTIALPKLFEEGLGDIASSPLGVGGMVSLVVGIAAFAQIVTGHLIDKFSAKLVWIGALFLQVPLLIVVGMLSEAGLLVAAFAVLVIIFGEIPIQDALLTRHTPDHLRSRIFGLKFALALGASALAVPIIAGLHATDGGFAWLFGMLAACALVVAFAAIWLPSRPHHLEAADTASAD
ncbi:MAG: MFS transporter [Alphaproteobacteria bacterium]